METTEAAKKAFGTQLRQHREDLDLTIKDLVDRLAQRGIVTAISTVSGWERGESSPRNRTVIRALDSILFAGGELASVLGVTHPRPSETTYHDETRDLSLGPVFLRRSRGEELTEEEEDLLAAVDNIDDGKYTIETTLYAVVQEVGQIRDAVVALAAHVGLPKTLKVVGVGGVGALASWLFESDGTSLREAASSGAPAEDEERRVSRPVGVPEEPGTP